ncbi:MAG: ABC transporter permease [Candidatus Acidiferrales bacterium]
MNPGFDPQNVLTFSLPFTGSRYEAQSAGAAFYDRLIPKLKALPGVEAASVITSLPLRGENGWGFVTEEHPSPPPNEGPDASYQVIAPDYFRALHIPLLQGRAFTDADQHESQPVVIINDALARAYWLGENPIGKRLRIGIDQIQNPWRTVVGVVGSVHRLGLDADFSPAMYVPYTQYPWANNPMEFVVRAASNPLALAPAIRGAVAEIDSDQAISNVITMQEVVTDSVSDREFNAALAAILAALALLLAAVGVYGSMSYAVSQRSHEFGIRMALGAQRRDILKLEIFRGFAPSLLGVCIGLAGAFALTRLMASLLFGVHPGDSVTFAVVTLLLLASALLA